MILVQNQPNSWFWLRRVAGAERICLRGSREGGAGACSLLCWLGGCLCLQLCEGFSAATAVMLFARGMCPLCESDVLCTLWPGYLYSVPRTGYTQRDVYCVWYKHIARSTFWPRCIFWRDEIHATFSARSRLIAFFHVFACFTLFWCLLACFCLCLLFSHSWSMRQGFCGARIHTYILVPVHNWYYT